MLIPQKQSLTSKVYGMNHSSILVLISFIASSVNALGDDWPCFQADASRSAVADSTLRFPLDLHWKYVPKQAPKPAWPEPGREMHRIDFDYAFQPVVVGERVYFGSSADDTLRVVHGFLRN